MRIRLCDTEQDVSGINVEIVITAEPFAESVPYSLTLHAGGNAVAHVPRGRADAGRALRPRPRAAGRGGRRVRPLRPRRRGVRARSRAAERAARDRRGRRGGVGRRRPGADAGPDPQRRRRPADRRRPGARGRGRGGLRPGRPRAQPLRRASATARNAARSDSEKSTNTSRRTCAERLRRRERRGHGDGRREARSDSRRRRSRSRGRRPTRSRAARPPRPRAGRRTRAAGPRPHRRPCHTGPTAWITCRAARLPAPVARASPVGHPPRRAALLHDRRPAGAVDRAVHAAAAAQAGVRRVHDRVGRDRRDVSLHELHDDAHPGDDISRTTAIGFPA